MMWPIHESLVLFTFVEVTCYGGRVVEKKNSLVITSILFLVPLSFSRLSLYAVTSVQSFVPSFCSRPTFPSKSSI